MKKPVAPPKKPAPSPPRGKAKPFNEREQLAMAKALRAKRKQPAPAEPAAESEE